MFFFFFCIYVLLRAIVLLLNTVSAPVGDVLRHVVHVGQPNSAAQRLCVKKKVCCHIIRHNAEHILFNNIVWWRVFSGNWTQASFFFVILKTSCTQRWKHANPFRDAGDVQDENRCDRVSLLWAINATGSSWMNKEVTNILLWNSQASVCKLISTFGFCSYSHLSNIFWL